MLQFGAWLTLTNVVGPFMVIFDRFLIGAIIGSAAVAVYVIPFNLISQLLLVPAALGNALFPSLAVLGRSADLNRKALLATTFFITPITLLAVVLLGPFLQVWIGGVTAQASTKIGHVLIIGGWANALAQLPHASLQASGRTDVTAKVHLAEVVPYLLMLWIGVSTLGVLGAAIAWSVRAIVDFVALAWADRVGCDLLRRALLQGCSVIALAVIMLTTDEGSIARWLLVAFTCGPALFYIVRTLPPDLAQQLINVARRASS
jgi:O-antigen/teichoic acid export membrane protein